MVAVPALAPVTIPLVPTLAMEVALLLHVPPAVASLSVVVNPWHTVNVPVIDAGAVPLKFSSMLDVAWL